MPTLYVVGTPIGNLGDMTPRAVEVLRQVQLIAAEDTRVTRKLTAHFGIETPLTSCHQHNEEGKGEALAQQMLAENMDMALTTDAGTPCISDPGYGLVRAAVALGIPVVAVPGCCAAISALSVSGMDTREFAFYGFLPREKKALREKLAAMAEGVPIAVVHESPFRVINLVETLADMYPQAQVSASCDLTKLHELTLRGSAGEVLSALRANSKAEKGEYCLVLDFHQVTLPEKPVPAGESSLEAQLVDQLLLGLDMRQAQAALVDAGAKKNAVKAAALRLKKLFQQEEEA